jgi:hypothetical protein
VRLISLDAVICIDIFVGSASRGSFAVIATVVLLN